MKNRFRIVDYLTIFLIAIAEAMDCFAMSISCGITFKQLNRRDAVMMGLAFGGFQGGMTLVGWLAAKGFYNYIEAVDHWIAFILLAIIGIHMIKEGLENKEECETFNIRKPKVLLFLSLATSIDSLAIGVTFAFLNEPMLLPVLAIGIAAFLFTLVGATLGKKLGHIFGNRMEIVGGLILISLGLKILLEHTIMA